VSAGVWGEADNLSAGYVLAMWMDGRHTEAHTDRRRGLVITDEIVNRTSSS